MKKNRIKKAVVILSILILLCLPLFYPYLEVDRLTKKYGEEFSELYRDNGFYSDIEYLKVIKYKEESAHFFISNKKISDEIDELSNSDALVLYIEEGHSSASLFVYTLEDNQWKFVEWYTLWAYSGSADDFFWPYYP